MPLGVSLNRAETWFRLRLRLTEWVSCIVYSTVYIFKNYSTTIFLTSPSVSAAHFFFMLFLVLVTNPLATSLFALAHYFEACNFYILVCLAKNRCSHFVTIYIFYFFYFTFFDAKYMCDVWTPGLRPWFFGCFVY